MPRRRTPHVPWSKAELSSLVKLDSPLAIQSFLDAVPYSADPIYRCPRSVLRDRKAHCYDGALLAAAALRHHGQAPVILNLRAVRDDDHVITLYRAHGRLGAIAKSNVVGLRFREPIFRNVRELVLSYFEAYYNLEKEKTLRAYSVPVDLSRFDALEWWFRDEAMDPIAEALDAARHTPIAPMPVVLGYAPVDARSFEAGLLGSNPDGLWKND